MKVPLVLFVPAVLGVLYAVLVPGQSDWLLLAGPAAVASVWLLLGTAVRSKKHPKANKWIVVDGSNVMHWQDGQPSIAPLRAVVRELKRQGYTPGVVFDANAGYKISGRYQDDAAMARLLDLPEARLLVVPKGVPADPTILASARKIGAQIVTNDRYRDWAADHPEVNVPGHLIRGRYEEGKLWLDLPA